MEIEFDADEMPNELEKDEKASLQPIRRHRRSKKVPLIAVVGRPNVGKSALVNRIAGTQSGKSFVEKSGRQLLPLMWVWSHPRK